MSSDSLPYPYQVSAYAKADGGKNRQLFTLQSVSDQKKLRDYAKELGGVEVGDWYEMADWHGVDDMKMRTRALGGHAYGLDEPDQL
jgi:hypothetical protein